MSHEPIAKAVWEVGSVIRRSLLSQMYQDGAVKLHQDHQDAFIGMSNSVHMRVKMLHVQLVVEYDEL
jgi:hypothetical protein